VLIKHWFGSLVNRAVALVVAVIMLSALIVTAAGSLISQAELQQQAKNQVQNIARLVASDLDDKLALRLETLNHIAQSMTMSELAFKSRAELLVKQQTAMQHLFDGIYLIDERGSVIAEYPKTLQQAGMDVSNREYFQQASTYLTPVISEPYASNYKGLPVVMIAAPVFDHYQRFIGVIAGAISLTGENFMDDISSVHIGETGYLGIATRSGITLAHGRTGEIMVPVRVENPVLKEAMEGFEGTRKTSNGAGEKTIMSVQQMAQVPWFVAAVWPAKEAYAPVTRMEGSLIWTLMGVILIAAPLAFWLFRQLMAPLQILARQINERHLGIRTQPVDVAGGDEIRQVAETFNTTMDERDEVLGSLAEREAFFRSLTQSAPIGIVQTDVLGRIEFLNPAFEDIMQCAGSELQHSLLVRNIYEPDRKQAMTGWRKAREERQVGHERRSRCRPVHGSIIWGDVMTSSIETPGKVLGTITVVRDISRELAVEEALKEEQQRAENILGVLQEGVLMVDTTGVIRYANGAA
jgi:PAS domain S-box-containing protein